MRLIECNRIEVVNGIDQTQQQQSNVRRSHGTCSQSVRLQMPKSFLRDILILNAPRIESVNLNVSRATFSVAVNLLLLLLLFATMPPVERCSI